MTIPPFRALEAGRTSAIRLDVGTTFFVSYVTLCGLGLALESGFARLANLPFGTGLAVAFLLVHGRRHWPTVLAAAVTAQLLLPLSGLVPLDARAAALAVVLAAVATGEALTAAAVAMRLFGDPLRFEDRRDLGQVAGLVLGLAVAAATAGVAVFRVAAALWPAQAMPAWSTWVVVDAASLLLAAPAVLLAPADRPETIHVGDRPLPRFSLGGTVAISASLAATLLAWTGASHLASAGGSELAAGALLLAGLGFTVLLAVHLLSIRMHRAQAASGPDARAAAERAAQDRAILETASAGILLLDGAGRILFATAGAAALFAIAEDALPGRTLPELLGGTDIGTLAGEGADHRQVLTKGPDGEPRTLDLRTAGWQTADGRRRLTVTVTERAARRDAAEGEAATRLRLDLALTAARIAVFEVEPATGEAVYSATWKALLGLPPDAAIDDRNAFLGLIHPDDRPILLAADAACMAGSADRSVSEFRVRMADGSWRWMRSEAVAGERDAEGRALRIVGVQADIDELVRGREALKASEEMVNLAIKAAPIGMAILGLDGRFQQVNDALGAFVGLERSEITGRNLDSLVHPDEQAWLAESVAGLLLGTRDKAEAELRCLHEDGSEIWGNLSIAVVRDSQGRALSFVVQVQDIDAQKKLERAKGEFIATVSHELRTPLTSISGSLGLMLNGVAGEMSEPARKMLTIAQKNASRLILLVNDILDMEKLSAGKVGFAFEDVDVAAIVRQSIADNHKRAEAMGIAVSADLGDAEPLVRADPARLRQVLTNFLSNAVKFSPKQGQIEVAAVVDETAVRISVTDHGPGVPPAFRKKIFLAFSQADSSATRSNEGSGLGLAISRQLVERMGGRIGFETDPGHATTFWCALPRVIAPGQAERDAAPAAADPGRPSILHVEADADFAEIVRTTFGQRAEIVHVAGASDAAALLKVRRFDLLLLDDGTVERGAPKLIDRFLRSAPDAPVMALTANDSPALDPRVQRSFIKTRAAVQRTVSACLAAIAGRPGRPPEPTAGGRQTGTVPGSASTLPADHGAAGPEPTRS